MPTRTTIAVKATTVPKPAATSTAWRAIIVFARRFWLESLADFPFLPFLLFFALADFADLDFAVFADFADLVFLAFLPTSVVLAVVVLVPLLLLRNRFIMTGPKSSLSLLLLVDDADVAWTPKLQIAAMRKRRREVDIVGWLVP